MLVEKYKPKKIKDIIGQASIIRKIEKWLKKPKKPLLIYGPSGTGKTIIPEVIANEKNMNFLEINASDKRSASSIKEILLPASKEGSLQNNKRLILIDEVDNFTRSDRGGIKEVIKILKESKHPIILTANNAYDKKLRTLRRYCNLIKIRRISKNLIEKKLREIARKEKLMVNRNLIREITFKCDGDLRSAINDLEIASKGENIASRDREKNIFKTLATIFKTTDLRKALKATRESDKKIEEIFWWVEQNICNEYKNPEEVAKAFDLLSKADLFRSKIIINQNYRFKIYMRNLIAGVALAKKRPYRGFTRYKPPDRLIMLGRTKALRHKNEKFYENLGSILHCSKRKIKEQMPYLNIIIKNQR